MKLQITLDIVDMGFHPTDDGLYTDVNAIILCVDYTKKHRYKMLWINMKTGSEIQCMLLREKKKTIQIIQYFDC